ncbi:HipA domain-containing protein [Hyphobacterium sp. SN044]|uniref:HipA domain-containing protein n=1 Tax=Hyphobacterium sp. SN044 TaxID=2912575 RepID=UPI001F18E637|nr:HipA domain-containing protein [Hyphobacterium sp. SN044]MCF8879826.1 HipA domain-containing protein [Hyphobacterium sp. SN044]
MVWIPEEVSERWMPIGPRIQQHAAEIVDVAGWEPDQDNPIPAVGKRAKEILVCPSPPPYGFLIGRHRYLFKKPNVDAENPQIWSEVIAYEIGKLCGIPVPPAFLAFNSGTNEIGVLIEFFFGYHDEENERRFVHAIDRFQALNSEVDFRRGSLRSNLLLTRSHRIPNWRDWWAETLAFDALISNGDRHSENWGFLVEHAPEEVVRYRLAPAFDNGSSLGWRIRDEDLRNQLSADAVQRFISRGKHHYGWIDGDHQGAYHVELCRKYLSVYETASPTFRRVIQLDDADLERVVTWAQGFAYPARFSGYRAEFMLAVLRAKLALLRAI